MSKGLRSFLSEAQITIFMGKRQYTIPLIDYIDIVAIQSGLNGYEDFSIETIKDFIKYNKLSF